MPPLHGTPPKPMNSLSEQGRENWDKIFNKKRGAREPGAKMTKVTLCFYVGDEEFMIEGLVSSVKSRGLPTSTRDMTVDARVFRINDRVVSGDLDCGICWREADHD